MFLQSLRFAASLVVIFIASLMTSQAALDILVIGSSHSYSESGETTVVHEKPFNPTAIATQLDSILDTDPAISETANVVFEDIYRTKTVGTAMGQTPSTWNFEYRCYSLAQYFMWPEGKDARMTNLRGAGTTAWDYIILVEDPYVMANFPGMYAEAVSLFQGEVSQGTAQLVLLAQWPENSSGFTATQFNEIVHQVGDSAGVAVAPAGKAWDGMGPSGLNIQDTDTSHPTPKGEYLAAATIYSKLFNRSAKTSNHDFPSDGDAIADHALSVTQAAAGVAQYSGVYTSDNPFQMRYAQKRHLDYSENGTSTEDGIIAGLNDAFAVCGMTSQKYSTAIAVDFHFSRGSDLFEADKQYLVNPALYDRSYGFPMQDEGTTGLETMIYGIDKRFYGGNFVRPDGTTYYNGTDLGVAHTMILGGEVAPTYDVKNIPMRLLWSKMHHQHPTLVHAYRNPISDLWHISDELERAMGAFLLTLNTGRCPVGDEPADNTTTEWQRWYGKKIGYETAWQMSHLTTRVPGFQVLPTAATANVVTPGSSESLSVRFRYPPTSDVTVNVTVDDPAAGAVSPSTLTFTPANYQTPQVVTVSAAPGSTSGTFPFVVNLATSSDDIVFNGHGDAWEFECERKFAQLSKTTSTVSEDGGTDTFTVALNWQPATDVVLDVSSSATGEATVSPATLTFTNGNWSTPQTVTITGVNDDHLATDTATVTIAVNDAASDNAFDAQPDQTVGVTCTNDDVAGFTLSKSTSTVAEDGGTDSFTVVLDAEPVSDVVIALASASPLEASVSPASLTFSPGNWNSPRTVTLTGVNDFSLSNDSTVITASIDPDASDDDFDAVADQTVTVTCTDDEDNGIEGSNTAPVVSPIADQTISLGALDPDAPTSDVDLVVEAFGGSSTVNLAGTTADTFDASLASAGGSGTWVADGNIKADGSGKGNNAKRAYLTLGSHINDSKGSADAKFELTATLSQPTNAGGYVMLSFSALTAPPTAANESLVASIGYERNGSVVISKGPGLGTLVEVGPMTGDRIFTIGLDLSPTYYNGSTTFGRITWSDSVVGVLATEDLTADLSFQSIVLVIDATKTGNRPAGTFSALSLTQAAATSSASTTISGVVNDAENNPLTLQWSVVSSPVGSSVTFGNDSIAETGATFTSVGDYTLRLTATDNWGASDSQDFVVSVSASDTTAPTLASTDIVDDQSGADVDIGTLVTYTVTFSEDMDAATVSAAGFSNAGTATVSIGTVTETSAGVFSVPVTPTGAGSLQLQVSASAALADVAGNALDTTSAIADNTTLTVLTAYESWTGGGSGTSFSADANGDGIADGLAWVLGASTAGTNAQSHLPVGNDQPNGDLTLQFSIRPGAATVILEYSNDLGVADTWSNHQATIPETSSTVNGVVFVITPNGEFNDVQATIPSAAAGAGKLFSRLSVEP